MLLVYRNGPSYGQILKGRFLWYGPYENALLSMVEAIESESESAQATESEPLVRKKEEAPIWTPSAIFLKSGEPTPAVTFPRGENARARSATYPVVISDSACLVKTPKEGPLSFS